MLFGTCLIDLGLKDKKIAVIGENRYEWEISYLSIVCGTGIVVPLDKSLPEKELKSLIERSGIEAIFCSGKYIDTLKKIKDENKTNLKYIISMEEKTDYNDIFLQKDLIEKGSKLLKDGDKSFIDAKIESEKMSIMLFTSGTTSKSKVVALSHKNICSDIMDIAATLKINSDDVLLSILPIHHVFECTVGFLTALYCGAETAFSDGIRHIIDNLKEYRVTVMACVPAIYERIFKIIRKKMEKEGTLAELLEKEKIYEQTSMEERKIAFKEIHDMLGGNIRVLISGAASLDNEIEKRYRLLGLNLVQAYGLTETSPVICVCSDENYRLGSVGKALPIDKVKIVNKNSEGIGELAVKGPNIMLGYFEDEDATKEVLKDGWFHTGDLARIDEDGFIFICGRKKSVIVLKNGKNIFPEEMENLINKIDGVKESFIFGKAKSEDENDIKINVKIVFDRVALEERFGKVSEEEIHKIFSEEIKEINSSMPKYKSIRGIILTEEPLIKTTTNKIKRQENLNEIAKSSN